jgi:MFS family permease
MNIDDLKQTKKLPLPVPFYYGWVIATMAAMSMFFSGPGQTFSISVFIDSYIDEFGWSRSLISSIYLFATLLAGFMLFIVGKLIDKYGQRYMSVCIAGMLAFACLFNSFIFGPVMLFFGFFMLRWFGQGAMTLLPGTLVPQWFVQKRGRALSIIAFGSFIGSAAIPPFNVWLINTWSWPVAWRIWFVLICLVFIPITFFLVRNKPEDLGLLPDGAIPKIGSPSHYDQVENYHLSNEHKAESLQIDEISWTLSEAKKTRAFWLILVCLAIPAMVNTGIVFHLVSILGEKGISRTNTAFILSLMAMVSFPITFLAGYIVDRVKVHYIFGFSFLGQMLVMFLLLQTESLSMAIYFGVLRGIVGAFEAISMGIILANYYGRKHLGSIKGISMTVMVIGSAFGPLPFAIAYDWFGGYTEIIWLMMIFPLLGSLASFASPPPKKQ